MANERSLGKRWQEYRPSKRTWFWSSVACVVATVVVGFTWGGWVTGGTTNRMAAAAAADARAQLAAAACVNRFENSKDAAAQLAVLKKAYTYRWGDLIEAKGWTTIPGTETPVAGAANLCAQRILKAGLPSTNG